MKKWEDMSNEEQIFLFWEYLAATDEEITFAEFDEIMKENWPA